MWDKVARGRYIGPDHARKRRRTVNEERSATGATGLLGDAPASTAYALSETELVSAPPSRRRFWWIHKRLREAIVLHTYPPGTRLDVDRLAAEFDVSRTPIRSVLQRLEHEGLVVTRHGVGTIVTEIDFERLREASLLRMELAELIGQLTPLPPTPAAIEAMEDLQAQCATLFEHRDIAAFGRIDIQVHEIICGLIGNSLLRQYYDELYHRTARMWFYFMPQLDWRSEISIFQADIEARVRAMRRSDTRAVGFLIRNEISAVVIRLADLFTVAEKQSGIEPAPRGRPTGPGKGKS
jgi:DNA-binding GntR family transcriptional regulator